MSAFPSFSVGTDIVGTSPDNLPLYKIGRCKRFGVTEYGDIYQIGCDTPKKTTMVYIPSIELYAPRILVGGVIVDKAVHYIGGNTIKTEYSEDGSKKIGTETINGIPFSVISGEEMTTNDHCRFFMEKSPVFKELKKDDFFILYNGFICYYSSAKERFYIEKEGTVVHSEGSSETYNIFKALVSRNLNLFIDPSSFIDIEMMDKALCFEELEKTISMPIEELNVSDMRRALRLSSSTLWKLKNKSANGDHKAEHKILGYKIVFGYLRAILDPIVAQKERKKRR